MKNRTFGSMPTYGEMERIKELEFDGTIEKTDREKAIEWWNSLTKNTQLTLAALLRGVNSILGLEMVTGREIEQIWRKETQQEKEEMPQVDFELLSLSVIAVSSNLKLTKKANLNLKLFFDLLSKSSTFAHKAHKELNKLTK